MIEISPTGVVEMQRPVEAVFKYGDTVKIIEGPLAGRCGIFQHSEKGRVALLLSLLSRETSVIMSANQVSYAGATL
jgi:transcription antitermination factor NusG